MFARRDSRTCAKWLAASAVAVIAAFAVVGPASATTFDIFAPARAGEIEFRLDANPLTGGGGCNVSLPIPFGITGPEKASLIVAAIVAQCPPSISGSVLGNVITLFATSGGSVWASRVTDSTGQVMLVTNDLGNNVPVVYKTKVKLGGGPGVGSGGGGKFGENGTSHTVPTVGKTIGQILLAWQAAFGEGTVNGNEFELPARNSAQHSYELQMLDPAFTIEVTQVLAFAIPVLPNGTAALLLTALLGIVLWARARPSALGKST